MLFFPTTFMLFFAAFHRCLLCRPLLLLALLSRDSPFYFCCPSCLLVEVDLILSFSLSFSDLLNCRPACRLYNAACNMKRSVQAARLEVTGSQEMRAYFKELRLYYFTLWSITDTKDKLNILYVFIYLLYQFLLCHSCISYGPELIISMSI